MKITETGYYKTLKDVCVRNAVSIGTLSAGNEIHITQVDPENHKVYASELLDWTFYELPVEKLEHSSCIAIKTS